ncbi:MAG: hypothetical protein ACM37W_27480 [Actinomycetota bacterium]
MNDDQPKTQFWKNCGLFTSGILVGVVLTLGGLLAWRQVQRSRSEIEIKLPSASSTPTSTPTVTPTTAIAPPPIPQPPATVRSQPASPVPKPSIAPQSPSPLSAKPSPSVSLLATKRVNFEVGSTGTSVRDSLKANQSKRYLFQCSSGQNMTVQIEEGVVSVAVLAPNGEKLGSAVGAIQWQGKLPSTGDYTLEISALSPSSYTVKVEVQ